MKQKSINTVHFLIRTMLTAGLFFFIINVASEEKFMNRFVLLIILAVLFLSSAAIEINFHISCTFWIKLPVRLSVFSAFWLLILSLLLFYTQDDMLVILFLIITFHLFGLLREWRSARRKYADIQ